MEGFKHVFIRCGIGVAVLILGIAGARFGHKVALDLPLPQALTSRPDVILHIPETHLIAGKGMIGEPAQLANLLSHLKGTPGITLLGPSMSVAQGAAVSNRRRMESVGSERMCKPKVPDCNGT